MKYYQVKNKSSQVRYNPKKTDVLIGGELFTPAEIVNMNLNEGFLLTHFNNVEVSKKQTYISFGARFPNHGLTDLRKEC